MTCTLINIFVEDEMKKNPMRCASRPMYITNRCTYYITDAYDFAFMWSYIKDIYMGRTTPTN